MSWHRQQAYKTPVLIDGKYKSLLEQKVAKQLSDAKIKHAYESTKVLYEVPSRKAKYTPDFTIGRMHVETKGYFPTKDRQKMVFARDCNPDVDVRIVFQRAKTKISKASPTSYGKWATDHGFKWADNGTVPDEWLAEMRAQAK